MARSLHPCHFCRDSAVVSYRLVGSPLSWTPGGVDGVEPWTASAGGVVSACYACDSLMSRSRWRLLAARKPTLDGVDAEDRDGVIAEVATWFMLLADHLGPPVVTLHEVEAQLLNLAVAEVGRLGELLGAGGR